MAVIGGSVDRGRWMGANLVPEGTAFRTWAPNAISVSVIAGADVSLNGQSMGWSPGPGDMLSALGDGSWGGALPGIGDGDPYMFFVVGQGSAGWKRDPYARELTADPLFPGCYCVVRDPATYTWQAAGWRPPPYEELIIYQLHVGTWWASDETGADARKLRSGTFLDAAEKLSYLKDLGVTAVQLLPVQEFETANSMGYNGVDYFSPEGEYLVRPEQIPWRLGRVNAMFAAFGKEPVTAAQLTPGINQVKCFIDLCHLNGIAVIFDLVYNHAGGGFDANSIWFYDRQANGNLNNSLFFTDQGWAGGQIFAYWNNWVSQFLIDNAGFFVREFRIDGIRYDEVRVIENNGGRAFCQNLTQTVRAAAPSVIQIAEYWNPDRPSAVAPPPDGLGFDAELGDGLRDALRALVAQASGGENASLDLSGVAANLPTPGMFVEPWRIVQCMENQDLTYAPHSGAARVPVLADPADHASWYARSRSRVATALLFAAPGIPAIFMGEEFLEDSNWSDDRSFAGLINWSALDGPSSVHRDFQRFVADLIALRRAHPAFRASGSRVSRCNDYDRVLVLHRWVEGRGQDLVAVASFDERAKFAYRIGLPGCGVWQEIFNSDYYDGFPNAGIVGNAGQVWAGGEPLDGFAASAAVTLPPNGMIVLARP